METYHFTAEVVIVIVFARDEKDLESLLLGAFEKLHDCSRKGLPTAFIDLICKAISTLMWMWIVLVFARAV